MCFLRPYIIVSIQFLLKMIISDLFEKVLQNQEFLCDISESFLGL